MVHHGHLAEELADPEMREFRLVFGFGPDADAALDDHEEVSPEVAATKDNVARPKALDKAIVEGNSAAS